MLYKLAVFFFLYTTAISNFIEIYKVQKSLIV